MSKGLAGFRSGKSADAAEVAAGRERTGERGGVRGPHVQNVGQTGKKGNGPGPRENSVGFLIN
jgi:hypothetical protein